MVHRIIRRSHLRNLAVRWRAWNTPGSREKWPPTDMHLSTRHTDWGGQAADPPSQLGPQENGCIATRNKCLTSSNKCLATSNNVLLGWRPSLVGWRSSPQNNGRQDGFARNRDWDGLPTVGLCLLFLLTCHRSVFFAQAKAPYSSHLSVRQVEQRMELKRT